MKLRHLLPLATLSLACTLGAFAQTGPAPAGSTGQCKDGSYTNTPTKSGACRGHKGVQQWFAENKPPASATATAKPTTAPQPRETPASHVPLPSSKPSPSSPQQAAAGGGPGMVWVNSESKVYHCPGDRYYGKTKQGKYMSEADAKQMGAKPDAGKPCK